MFMGFFSDRESPSPFLTLSNNFRARYYNWIECVDPRNTVCRLHLCTFAAMIEEWIFLKQILLNQAVRSVLFRFFLPLINFIFEFRHSVFYILQRTQICIIDHKTQKHSPNVALIYSQILLSFARFVFFFFFCCCSLYTNGIINVIKCSLFT